MQGNQDTFYLTLPSNGYDTIYRDNTSGSFKADLVQTQFVGKSETDLLREVEYDGSMNGMS